MTEVIPGIYQLKLPLPEDLRLGYVNAYLIRGDNGYLLVDSGLNTGGALGALKKQLAEIGADIKDISQIVITHTHADHYGLTGKLKQLCQAKFYLHSREKDLIDSRYTNMAYLLEQMARWLSINGVPPVELPDLQTTPLGLARFVARVLPDVILHGDETISTGVFTFRVLWTPGHSPGHICLYEPARKLLLSGDHILPTITPNIGLHPQSADNPLGDYINSLNAIKQLDVDIILGGHENPFTGLKARIETIVQHHEQRNQEVLSAIEAGAITGYQIARKLTWLTDTGGARWEELSLWDKSLAVLETLAHLEAMRVDGKTDKFSKNSIIGHKLTEQ